MEILDISPTLSSKIAVFPGDTEFQRKVLCTINESTNFLLSTLTLSCHTGAHADAPNHYHKNGRAIHEQDLSLYIGGAQVISVKTSAARIKLKDIEHTPIRQKRILFKTESFPNPQAWNDNFKGFEPEVISYLAKKNVKLIGIDTPSVDESNDKKLVAHHEIYKNDIAILEGLVLKDVQDGEYFLVALPLKILNADASPVRAVLIKNQNLLKEFS